MKEFFCILVLTVLSINLFSEPIICYPGTLLSADVKTDGQGNIYEVVYHCDGEIGICVSFSTIIVGQYGTFNFGNTEINGIYLNNIPPNPNNNNTGVLEIQNGNVSN
jgi:hypothetical protein